MTSEHDSEGFDPEYVAACRVLLDALEALAPHRSAFMVAGAQAVYLRAGESETGIAPYTTDGDLALDPMLLTDDPRLEKTRAFGYSGRRQLRTRGAGRLDCDDLGCRP